MADRASKDRPPPLPLAQGLDPPLVTTEIISENGRKYKYQISLD